MLIIPAIDLKDGQCVRLRQGRMEDSTHYSDDPLSMAQRWFEDGARRLHLVDLNGAFEGVPVNGEAIMSIAGRYPDKPIQVGGGIRSLETIAAYLDIGVSYAIIGTQAVRDPDFVATACRAYPGHIIVGLDARDGRIATDGWATQTEHDVIEFALRLQDDGVSAIVYTDIGRDGMLSGPNIDATAALAEAIDIPVVASGGISRIEDIEQLCGIEALGVMGAITGRAIYQGTLDFAEAQRLADRLGGN